MAAYWIVVNLTPFPIKAEARHGPPRPSTSCTKYPNTFVILPGETHHLPCFNRKGKSYTLSTSMSLPYSQLYSLVDLPGEVLLAKIALAAPYAVVRRELRNYFEVNYSRFPSGHMFELTYNPRVSVCAQCVAEIDGY